MKLKLWFEQNHQLGIGLAVLIGLVFMWALLWIPWVQVTRLEAQWRQSKAQAQENRDLTARAVQNTLQELPTIQAVPQILEQLHAQAREEQVEIKSLTPGAVRAAGENEPGYLPIELQVEGSYADVGRFLGALQRVEPHRATVIQRIRIPREEGILPRLRVQLQIEMALQQR